MEDEPAMPIYVYRCTDCQEQTEVIQHFEDPPLEVCSTCGGTLRRLLFPPAIVFKGAGWYCTDHRSPSSPGNGSSHKTAEPGSKEKPAKETPVAGVSGDSE